MQTSDYISLLSSIGACLAAIMAWLTLIELKQQRASTYRPDLVIPSLRFQANYRSISDPLSAIWHLPFGHDEKLPSSDTIQYATADIKNIGKGAAKHVNVVWSYQKNKLVELFNALAAPDYSIETSDGMFWRVNGAGSGYNHRMFESQNIPYIYPVGDGPEKFKIHVPSFYQAIISAIIFISIKNRKVDELFDLKFGSELTLTYHDIGGSTIRTTFIVSVDFDMLAHGNDTDPPMFQASLDFTPAESG